MLTSGPDLYVSLSAVSSERNMLERGRRGRIWVPSRQPMENLDTICVQMDWTDTCIHLPRCDLVWEREFATGKRGRAVG